MSKTMKYGLAGAAAAVVVVAIIGAQLFGSVGPSPGEDPSPSSAPSEAATSNEPSAGGLPVNSILAEGPLLLWDGAPDGVSITVDIAGTEWWGRAGKGWFTNRTDTNGHPGTGMIVFGSVQEYYVYGDPCLWLTTKPETAVTTVDEVVAALKATTSATEADHELLGQWASEITDILVDGYSGKAITLHAPGIFPHMCDADQWAYFATEDDSPARYLDRDGPPSMQGQTDEFWILDVGGSIIILDIGYYSDTPQSVVDELRSMLASATFE